MRVRGHLYALVPIVIAALVAGVVVIAAALTLLPAFVTSPGAGADATGVEAWRALAAVPGIGASVAVTFATSAGATLVSFFLACCIGVWAMAPRRRSWALVVIASVAAVPPVALATGLGELASRADAWWPAWLPGLHAGTGMLLVALSLRITPFFAAMMLIAMARVVSARDVAAATTLGYGRAEVFAKLILPQVYRGLRLPVAAALAWSLSAVGTTSIIDPGKLLLLDDIAWHGLAASAAAQRALGAAATGAVLALALAAVAFGLALERIVGRAGRAWFRGGRRGVAASVIAGVGVATSAVGLALVVAALCALVAHWAAGGGSGSTLLTFAPSAATGVAGKHARSVGAAVVATLAIGVVATLVALLVAIGCLEAEDRSRRRGGWPTLLWVPWIVPQIAFVPGIAWILADGGRAPFVAAIASQLVFVLPCVALVVTAFWRALDPRYARCAASLGAAPRRVLARVKLPLVARPIGVACAIAFAASVGLFLPTPPSGADRIATLDTDVVSRATTPVSREAALEAALLALAPAAVVAAALWRRTRRTPVPAAPPLAAA